MGGSNTPERNESVSRPRFILPNVLVLIVQIVLCVLQIWWRFSLWRPVAILCLTFMYNRVVYRAVGVALTILACLCVASQWDMFFTSDENVMGVLRRAGEDEFGNVSDSSDSERDSGMCSYEDGGGEGGVWGSCMQCSGHPFNPVESGIPLRIRRYSRRCYACNGAIG